MTTVQIFTNFVHGGWSPTKKFLGGSEEYVVETAAEIAKRGYQVKVYHNADEGFVYGDHKGVMYLPHDRYEEWHPEDGILIAFKAVPSSLRKRNIYVTNDVNDKVQNFPQFDYMVGISNWHVDNIMGRSEKSKVIYLACHHQKYIGGVKVPKKCLYSSSPDRGLEVLLNIWEEVHKETGAELFVTYGGRFQREDKTSPGVHYLGFLTEEQMEEQYKTSQFWLHPCTGIELFCVSGYKAQIAGCIPVIIPTMALSETILFGVRSDLKNYKDTLIKTIKNPPEVPVEYSQIVLGRNIAYKTWEDVTDELVELF
jgi:hypothetical protein